FFFFQAEDGIRDGHVTGVQTCALPICIALMKLLANAPGLQQINPGTSGGFNAQFLDHTPVNGNEMNLRGDVNLTQNTKVFATFRSEERRVGKECRSTW